jgi:hypothetical protein
VSELFLFGAAIAKAVMDLLAHGKLGSGHPFWDASLSWRNKWAGGDPSLGEAFPGSSTIFVFLTDGWHLAQAVMLICVIGGVVSYKTRWSRLIDFVVYSVGFRAIFEGVYSFFG